MFEISDDASATEDSGSPIRNIATSRKSTHVESRSPHDVLDLRAMLSGRVCFLKRPGRLRVVIRGIALLQTRTVSRDKQYVAHSHNQQRSKCSGLHWGPGAQVLGQICLTHRGCLDKNWLVRYNDMHQCLRRQDPAVAELRQAFINAMNTIVTSALHADQGDCNK